MGVCTICRDGRKEEIEALHVSGSSYDELAARFGIHRSSVARHMSKHLTDDKRTKLLCGTSELHRLKALVAKDASTTLETLTLMRGVLLNHFLRRAEDDETFRLGSAARALLDVTREVGKLRGEITTLNPALLYQDNRVTNVAMVTSAPEFVALANGLIEISRNFPETRTAIVALLRKVEGGDEPVMAAIAGPGALHAA